MSRHVSYRRSEARVQPQKPRGVVVQDVSFLIRRQKTSGIDVAEK
jgi:hypothetical protein